MQLHNTDKHKYNIENKKLYALVFYIAVIASLVICIIAPFFIEIIYGEDYLPAVEPLRIVVWMIAFSYLGVARNAWVVCQNKQKYLKYIYISAAFSNVVLNLILIPLFGAAGAAVASLTTQVVTTFVAPFFIKDMRENSILMVQAILFKGVLK